MRVGVLSLVIALLLASSLPQALAASDLETFQRRLSKSAAQDVEDLTPKLVCVCKDGGPFQDRAGGLVQAGGWWGGWAYRIRVWCRVPDFDGPPPAGTGALNGFGDCFTWELLPK